jgi:hypothetical protein
MMPVVKGIEQFRSQINLLLIRQDVTRLRQELESQKILIAQTRRSLPRGWYRQSPTVDLEVSLNVSPANSSICLPCIWPASLTHNPHR